MSRVLVVEDYDDSREFLKFLLEMYGFEVDEASNGIEALKAIHKHVPDLVLMDMAMPAMDGVTATRKIREEKRFAKLPIIAITAQSEGYRRPAFEAGCNAMISKPIDIDALRPVLNRYLHPQTA
ncbi:MAG TPA: response regulator [Pyrinomonadaceae bacterium]|jgi:CheY-like chemotaxis protein|nr:response regulator [Pyrinomonadaceae bacterium]